GTPHSFSWHLLRFFQVVDVRDLQPVGPAAGRQPGLHHTVVGTHGFDHIPVTDVDPDVSGVPYGQPRDLRDGRNTPFLQGCLVHLICTNVRHTVGAIVHCIRLRIVPAVAFDKPDTVR